MIDIGKWYQTDPACLPTLHMLTLHNHLGKDPKIFEQCDFEIAQIEENRVPQNHYIMT